MPTSPAPSLPPRVTSVRNAIFEAPDEAGLSISVPTSYSLFVGTDTPVSTSGVNGDWYMKVGSEDIITYRKVMGIWNTVSTIEGGDGGGGGGGGGGGDLDGITITGSIFDDGTITGSAISGSTWSGGSITGATLTSSTLTSPTITNPTVTTGTFTNAALTTPTLTNATINGGTITGATITGLATPVADSDAASKEYVDAASQGLFYLTNARVATTANVTLSGGAPSTLDGVSLATNDRILVKNQSTTSQNGVYVVSTLGSGSNGTWTRATDADAGDELVTGAYIFVSSGTVHGTSAWVMSTPGPIVVGTTPIVWVLHSQLGNIPATSITGQLVTAQIADLALTTAKFAASIRPVEIVSSLPTTGNTEGRTVYLTTTDGAFAADKIYRWTSAVVTTGTAHWTAAVPAVDITGNLTSDQISDLAAAKITGQITSTQITDGAISAPKISAGAVIAGKLAADSIVASNIQSGAVTAGKIAANAVTSDTIVANAVTFGKVAAGAIRSNEIFAEAINGGHIAAGSISTTHILAGAIQANNIAAGAVTAGKISVGDLATISPDLGTVTAGAITANTSLDIGSGLGRVQISTSGLSIASGRISAAGDGANPWIKVAGAGAYASQRVEINGSNAGASGPYFSVSGGASTININSGGGISISGGYITVGAGTAIRGTGGGEINIQGGSSDALDVICGESGGTITPDGVLILKVNGRSVKVEFEEV